MGKIKIGKYLIGEGEPVFIVAEVGLNHNGNLDTAKQLIDVAVMARVNAVKFQKRNIDKILIKEVLDSPYNVWYAYGRTYGEHRKALELSDNDYREIIQYCRKREMMFLASAWDEGSVDFLSELKVPAYKIASADVTNLPLLEYIAKKNKPIILSTGMSTMEEVAEAVAVFKKHHNQLILLQCTSSYPSKYEDINLRAMKALKEKFQLPAGYSGHERGIAISTAAVALGAVLIERHFTLDRAMKGPDHAASLEPQGLMKLVRDIRNIECAYGNFEKKIVKDEIPIRNKLRKSLVARINIPKGTKIFPEMLTLKSPGTGLLPKYIYRLVGKKALRDIKEDTLISKEDIEQ